MSSKANINHQLPISLPSSVHEGGPTIEQLRMENIELRQENGLLNEVISTIGSTLKLDEVLHHLVGAVVRATSCHHAFIYMYDKDKERLVLTCTSERHQHLVGKISMALGEGIVGWVALHRIPVYLKEEAMGDPRFRYFPELEEEKFQSMMTVPIIAKDQQIIGVMMLQAAAPYELSQQHQRFISNIAALAASAIENAQLYENTQRKLRILTSLSVLSQTISSGLYLDDMLHSLATLTVQIMEVDLCVIMLMDQARDRDADLARHPRRLTVRATSPNLNDRAHFQPIDVDRQTLERLRELNETAFSNSSSLQYGHTAEMNTYALEQLNPLSDLQYKSLISAPIIASTEHLGLINCYTSKTRRYTFEDQTLLTTIANQAAIAIKNSHLVNQLAQKNLVKGFFDDLIHGTSESEDSLRQRASFLGCDLTRPHTAVMIEITYLDDLKGDTLPANPPNNKEGRTPSAHPAESLSPSGDGAYTVGATLQATYKRIGSLLRRRIQDSFAGSLFHGLDNVLTCIIPFSKDPTNTRLKTWLYDLARQVRIEYHVHLSIGIGNLCQSINDYRRGFAEAQEALQMGQNLQRATNGDEKAQPLVTHFNDLGVYRYLYKIAHMDDLRDMYQDQIARIANYDRRKNTDLLMTLETYLECAGNLTKTSERLFVHRNTLIQRLERIQSLCEVDLQDRANWLTLQIAIKVYKLRMGSV